MGKGIIASVLGFIAFIFVAIPIIIVWYVEGEVTNALLEALGASSGLIILISILGFISIIIILKSKL
ncbi:MAG: hypothetical protein ACFFKA_04455 [Candidatus Thorarchaeota archaeon]